MMDRPECDYDEDITAFLGFARGEESILIGRVFVVRQNNHRP